MCRCFFTAKYIAVNNQKTVRLQKKKNKKNKKNKGWIFVQKRATDYTTFLSVGFILQNLATSYTTFLSVGFLGLTLKV